MDRRNRLPFFQKIFFTKRKLLCFLLVFSFVYTEFANFNIFAIEDTANQASVASVTGITDYFDFEELANNQIISKKNANIALTLAGSSASLSDSDAVFGKSIKFGSHNDNKAEISNYLNSGVTDLSFSFWYKHDNSLDGNGNQSSVLLQQTGSGKTLLARKVNGQLSSYIYAKDVESRGLVPAGTWTHIAVTFNHTTKKGIFYINGQKDSEVDLGSNLTNAVTNLRIGAHKNENNSDPHPMRGELDDLYIFKDKIINESEVSTLYLHKALLLEKERIKTIVAQAESLIADSNLPAGDEYLVALKSILAEAKNRLTLGDVSLAQLEESYQNLATVINNYVAAKPININIDENSVERKIYAKSIFGINHRYAFNGYGTFDEQKKVVKEDFKNLYKEANFGSIRYPGGTISNLFNWKTARGDLSERKAQIHGFYNYSGQGGIFPNFGLAEIGTFAQEVGSEIVYVYSLARGSVQDVEDLAEYLNAKVGTNFNGGIDWAKVRENEGHSEPFNVRYFEMGNEMNQGGHDGSGSQQYWLPRVEGKDSLLAYIEGGVASFSKQYAVKEEDWNKATSVSDGSANLIRYMRYANINPRKLNESSEIITDENFRAVLEEGLAVYVGNDSQNEEWTRVEDFSNSNADDQHYKVDFSQGAIIFGDGIRGKIPAKGQQIYVSYKVNKDGFINLSRALKNAMAKINELEGTNKEANVYTSYENPNFINKMRELGADDYYDGMSIHPYSGTVTNTSSAESFYDEAMHKAETRGIGHVRHYVDLLPKGKVPVISEFGIFRNTQSQVRSLTHALYIAKNMLEFVKLGSPYIQKHCLVDWYSSGADALGPTQQAVIQAVAQEGASTKYGTGNFSFFSTPSAEVFAMLNNGGFADNIIPVTVNEHSKINFDVTPVSALGSKDEKGNIYIALLNLDRTRARRVSLNFVAEENLNSYKLEQEVLTSAGIDDENTPSERERVKRIKSNLDLSNLKNLSLPKASFTVLKILKPESAEKDENEAEPNPNVNGGENELPEESISNQQGSIIFEKKDNGIGDVTVEVAKLTDYNKEDKRLENFSDYTIYSIRLKRGNEYIEYKENEQNGKASLKLKKENNKIVKKVYYLPKDSKKDLEEIQIIKQDEKEILLAIQHLSDYIFVYEQKNNVANEEKIDIKNDIVNSRIVIKNEKSPNLKDKQPNTGSNSSEEVFYYVLLLSLFIGLTYLYIYKNKIFDKLNAKYDTK